jgi:hypothetical protein
VGFRGPVGKPAGTVKKLPHIEGPNSGGPTWMWGDT